MGGAFLTRAETVAWRHPDGVSAACDQPSCGASCRRWFCRSAPCARRSLSRGKRTSRTGCAPAKWAARHAW